MRNISADIKIGLIWPSTARYFFFPTVRLATIDVKAAAMAPANAAAPPPPGVGASEANSAKNSLQGLSINCSVIIPLLTIISFIFITY